MYRESGPGDLDPGAPIDALESLDVASAAAATNYGLDGKGDVSGLELPGGPLGKLDIDIGAVHAFLDACMSSIPRVEYKLGGKIQSGQVPGRDFTGVDCSGFVREAIRRSTNLGNAFPDGSAIQHDWVKSQGFKPVTIEDGKDSNGVVQIAFLSPNDSPSRIGHVVLLHLGKTLESHGGAGPDSRWWTGEGWQAKAKVYLLDPRSAWPGS